MTALQFANPIAAVGGAVAGLAIGLPSLRRLLPAGVHRAARGLPAVVLCRILATAAFLGADSFIPLAADRIHGASPTIQGFVIIGASLSWTGGQWFMSRHPGIDPRRAVRLGFAIVAFGLAASIPVLAAGWPLWATFFGWAIRWLRHGSAVQPHDGDGHVVGGRRGRGAGQQSGQPGRRHRLLDDGRHRRSDGGGLGAHQPVAASGSRHQLRIGHRAGRLGNGLRPPDRRPLDLRGGWKHPERQRSTRRQRLLRRQHRLEQIAEPVDTLQHIAES